MRPITCALHNKTIHLYGSAFPTLWAAAPLQYLVGHRPHFGKCWFIQMNCFHYPILCRINMFSIFIKKKKVKETRLTGRFFEACGFMDDHMQEAVQTRRFLIWKRQETLSYCVCVCVLVCDREGGEFIKFSSPSFSHLSASLSLIYPQSPIFLPISDR